MKSTRTAIWAATALLTTGLLAGTLVGTASAANRASGAVATDTVPVTHEQNDRVPKGAAWTQHYFPATDDSGTELHADVLLPEGLAPGEQVPVILSIGGYFGHAGQVVPEPFTHTGPSIRFSDLFEGADLFARGYAFVMVDSRGHGGSTGCVDFVGSSQQADVRAAIDWSASQPWSTGAVGMYGKSYDATTGLIGNNLNQDALKAVVAQEPVWDPYLNFRSNGVPRTTIFEIPNIFTINASLPQMPDDDPHYLANAAFEVANPQCFVESKAGYLIGDPQSEYWQTRDLVEQAKGSDTPLLFTQGFLEWNTEADLQEYLANHNGPQRGWLGQWDHVRGNDRTDEGVLEMGREGWFAETMAFYDQYLKGIEPAVDYPAFALQDSTGSWRVQDSWPIVDTSATLPLAGGTYVDNGVETGAGTDNSFVTWSEPLRQTTRVTGAPQVRLTAEGNGNVMIKLYDVAPDGAAVMFDEQVSVLGTGETSVDLRSTDWTMAAGQRLAVEIGTIPTAFVPLDPRFGPGNDWISMPSGETIQITDAQLDVALNNPVGDTPTSGDRSTYLDIYLAEKTSTLPIGPATFTVPEFRG